MTFMCKKIEIFLADVRGFCAGVERALQIVEKALQEGPFPVYVLHEIVHNEAVVEDLRKRGVVFADHIRQIPAGSGTLIFSAHGVGKMVEKEATATSLHIVDATCPIVKKLHRKMEEYEAQSRHILLLGKKGHREVEGLLGRVDSPVTVLDSIPVVESFLKEANRTLPYGSLSQTTLNAADVEKMSLLLKERLPDLEISAEVCFATRDRQNAVRVLAQKCSLVLVVGSEKSSNTKRLLETAIQCGAKAYLVPRAGAVKPEWFRGVSSVGVTSGASCPESLLQDVCAEIRHITGE